METLGYDVLSNLTRGRETYALTTASLQSPFRHSFKDYNLNHLYSFMWTCLMRLNLRTTSCEVQVRWLLHRSNEQLWVTIQGSVWELCSNMTNGISEKTSNYVELELNWEIVQEKCRHKYWQNHTYLTNCLLLLLHLAFTTSALLILTLKVQTM